MKKIISIVILAAITSMIFAGCKAKDTKNGEFDKTNDITVVSREDGSGTRGAFIELFDVLVKGSDGSKSDKTTKEAVIANKTDVMLTNVSGDNYAIGYVSLGSLNDTVKALKVDGVEATSENVNNKSYKVARPFMIATKGEATGLKKDFIDFILSKQGQEVVAKSYISIGNDAVDYASSNQTGKLVIAGSSSVTPIMEKLKEAYVAINKDVEIQIQQSDSTSGMTGAIDGTCDIGMASRDLKDSEKQELVSTSIAIDGIAVVVSPKNTVDNITSEQVNKIFTGKMVTWDEID